MSLLGRVRSRFRRPTANEKIVGQCKVHWEQRGLSELKTEELCDDLEGSLETMTEMGYGPESIVGDSVRKYAEAQAEENASPKRELVTAYKVAFIASVSACAILVPQHVLLSSWTVPVGWLEIAAIAAVFSVIGLLQWPRFSSVTYNFRKWDGLFFTGDIWTFIPCLLIGAAVQMHNFESAATQVFGWSGWASLTAIGLALLINRLYKLSAAVPVTPEVGAREGRDEPSKSKKASLGIALMAFFCHLTAWLISDGLTKDWATLMLIASSVLLMTILPAFRKRESKPPVFE